MIRLGDWLLQKMVLAFVDYAYQHIKQSLSVFVEIQADFGPPLGIHYFIIMRFHCQCTNWTRFKCLLRDPLHTLNYTVGVLYTSSYQA